MQFAVISLLMLLTACSHSVPEKKLTTLDIQTESLGPVRLGAFSGLYHAGENTYWTLTDRGPNTESLMDQKRKRMVRPFLMPDFQPRLVKLLQTPTGVVVSEIIPLTYRGKAMTGLPNKLGHTPARIGDEFPVDTNNQALKFDPMGLDPEGICLMNNEFWLVEEYGPSILRFNLKGELLKRYLPQGYFGKKKQKLTKEILPEELLSRHLNRGFEGVACHDGKVWAVIQTPLPGRGSDITVYQIDVATEKYEHTFSYRMEDGRVADKIGDLAFFRGKLYFIEQNSKTGPESFHRVYSAPVPSKSGPLTKTLVIDLVKAGYDFADKVEGLTILSNKELAVVNDQDFGLSVGANGETLVIEKPITLGIIKLD